MQVRLLFELLQYELSKKMHPECEIAMWDRCPSTNRLWPVLVSSGLGPSSSPRGALIGQTVGSGPLCVQTTWQIRRYGTGSDVNVLLLCDSYAESIELTEQLAVGLRSHPSIATVNLREGTKEFAACLHVHMFEGLHFGLSMAIGRPAFDMIMQSRDWMVRSLFERSGLQQVIVIIKKWAQGLPAHAHRIPLTRVSLPS